MQTDAMTHWKALRQGGDESLREHMIQQNTPLVHHLARRIHRRLGSSAVLGDLVNAGFLGLLQAIDTFDPERGHAFSTHAVPRIRGAILDELRTMDYASRAVRRRQRNIAAAERELSIQLDRVPLDRETAERLDVNVETLWKWKADARDTTHLSIDGRVAGHDSDGMALGDFLTGSNGSEVENRLALAEEAAALGEEIKQLTERERIVLMFYYYDGLKLREIAQVLGLTESRVSQIRTGALRTLRARMRRLREEP